MLEELYAKMNKLSTNNTMKIFSTLRDAKSTNLKTIDLRLDDNFMNGEAVDAIIVFSPHAVPLRNDTVSTLHAQKNS